VKRDIVPMDVDKPLFYHNEIAAHCFYVSYVLIVAGIYRLPDKVGPT
jgi:hypothetical protein